MKMRPDPIFSDTKDMNAGDIVSFDPSTEGTGAHAEGVIAKKYHFSLVLEDGIAIGIARVHAFRRPAAVIQMRPQRLAPEKPGAKPWFIRSDEDEKPPDAYA